MATSRKRQIDELRQRVSRLTGEIRESDFAVLHLYAAGDPEETCYVRAARHGRYSYFVEKQWGEIAALMAAAGYAEDGDHQWKRVLMPEEMAERDGEVTG